MGFGVRKNRIECWGYCHLNKKGKSTTMRKADMFNLSWFNQVNKRNLWRLVAPKCQFHKHFIDYNQLTLFNKEPTALLGQCCIQRNCLAWLLLQFPDFYYNLWGRHALWFSPVLHICLRGGLYRITAAGERWLGFRHSTSLITLTHLTDSKLGNNQSADPRKPETWIPESIFWVWLTLSRAKAPRHSGELG